MTLPQYFLHLKCNKHGLDYIPSIEQQNFMDAHLNLKHQIPAAFWLMRILYDKKLFNPSRRKLLIPHSMVHNPYRIQRFQLNSILDSTLRHLF
jgi:hypothetical protein